MGLNHPSAPHHTCPGARPEPSFLQIFTPHSNLLTTLCTPCSYQTRRAARIQTPAIPGSIMNIYMGHSSAEELETAIAGNTAVGLMGALGEVILL